MDRSEYSEIKALVGQVLSPNGGESLSVAQEYSRCHSAWSQARREFLKVRVVHHLLEDLVLARCEDQLDSEWRRRPHVLRLIVERLSASPQPPARFDEGLDVSEVHAVQCHLKTQLLNSLTSLLGNYFKVVDSDSENYIRLSTLPDLIRNDVEQVLMADRAVLPHFQSGSTPDSFSLLERHREHLVGICQRRYLAQNVPRLNLQLDVLKAKQTAMDLKVEHLHREVLAQTYSPEATKALEKIRAHLMAQLNATKSEIDRLRSVLVQYQAVGSEFDQLVDRYAGLQADIEGKKWSIEQLMLK